jgi:hypothetical protein
MIRGASSTLLRVASYVTVSALIERARLQCLVIITGFAVAADLLYMYSHSHTPTLA